MKSPRSCRKWSLAGCVCVVLAWSCDIDSSRSSDEYSTVSAKQDARRVVFHTGILLNVDAVPANAVQVIRHKSQGDLDSGHTTVHIRTKYGSTTDLSDEGLPNGKLRVNGKVLSGQAFRVDAQGKVTLYDASGEPDLLGLDELPEN